MYIADTLNYRIRKVSSGIISTIAGTGSTGFGGDGLAGTATSLYNPCSVVVDSSGLDYYLLFIQFIIYHAIVGHVYIADKGNHRIRKITSGTITTIAGSSTSGSFSGDNGQATSATLYLPFGVALDASGIYAMLMNVFVLFL